MTATLMVRAEVGAEDRDAFERWYQEEHLPDAAKAFDALSAWRGWSDVDPSLHYAFYQFDSLERLRGIMGSEAIADLIAEFDRVWEGRVVRTREIIDCLHRIEGGG